MADIPGLVEGAHENRGLGHAFLRHVERTRVLLVVLDGAGSEGRAPMADLDALLYELRKYDRSMLKKPMLVFANKTDLLAGLNAAPDGLDEGTSTSTSASIHVHIMFMSYPSPLPPSIPLHDYIYNSPHPPFLPPHTYHATNSMC
jgi:GTPase involved in cell partitioning and DNA repair